MGTLLILILPIAYVALKLGAQPESVFIVQLAVFVVAQIARIWMLRPLISFSMRAYIHKTALPITYVTLTSLVVPLAVYILMQPSFGRFLAVCIVSVLSVSAAVYFIGLVEGERRFIIDKAKGMINKIKR